MNNQVLKLIFSLPVVLLLLYLFPVLGVFFAIGHLFYHKKAYYYLPRLFLSIGIILCLPKILEIVSQKFSFTIASLSELLEMPIYSQMYSYGELLVILGVILLVLSELFNVLARLGRNSLIDYIKGQELETAKLTAKNELKMKEKIEKSKNSHVVICPYCGADNLIYGNSGTCKYCRKKISL